jgi:hypothetical protein
MCQHTKQGRAEAAAAAGNTCGIACSDCDAVTAGGGHVQGELYMRCVWLRACVGSMRQTRRVSLESLEDTL